MRVKKERERIRRIPKQKKNHLRKAQRNPRTNLTINSSRSGVNKNSAIGRIKAIQEKDWKEWKNLGISTAGRPGTANIVKRRTQDKLNTKQIVNG